MKKSFSLKNANWKAEIKGDCSFSLTDLRTGMLWETPVFAKMCYGDFYNYNLAEHCRTVIRKSKDKLTVIFDKMEFWARFKGHGYVKPEPGPALKFEFSVTLKEEKVIFRVERINGMDEEECKISFPCGLIALDSSEKAEVLLPLHFGQLFKLPCKEALNFKYDVAPASMPVHGIFTKKGGAGLYIKTPFDSTCEFDVNNDKPGKASLETGFIFEKHNANYARELHVYSLGKKQNYVDLAKLYRGIVKSEKRFVSLNDKIRKNPEVEKLIGSVIWKHNVYSAKRQAGVKKSYSLYMLRPKQNQYEKLPNNWTAKEVFDTASAKGFDRVCVYNTGWNNKGFDSGYPTRFPPNPERGTMNDFKKAAAYARSLSPDYIYSVHDNYLDVYENSNEFDKEALVRNKDGSHAAGGIWRGGRAYIMCSSQSMAFAQRDIPQIVDMLGKGSIYIDVAGCVPLRSCHNPTHPQGRKQDAEGRHALLNYVKNMIGSVATEGYPADYLADVVDLGAFCGIYLNGAKHGTDPLFLPVPFWQLVYHDSVLNYTSESTFGAYGSEYILYVALFGLLPTQFDKTSKKLSYELRSAYKSEMLSHELLEHVSVTRAADGTYRTSGAAKTVFADGTVVVANFNEKDYFYDGHKIKGRDFIILNNKNKDCK